jgi:hypothetical protein
MPSVGFEPTIPVFQRVKKVHALDHPATVIGAKDNPKKIQRRECKKQGYQVKQHGERSESDG